ncbi:MAG TPA: thiamine pyrophosphate-dependent enzyme [Steroidobacteraceae bacterium]
MAAGSGTDRESGIPAATRPPSGGSAQGGGGRTGQRSGVSRLHVPHPPARPGDRPDFSYVKVSPAGSVGRPDTTAALAALEPLASQMVRVLDEDHHAVGPWNPRLDPEDLQVGLRHMVLTRRFDERMLRIQRQGRISFYMKSTGEEAVSVAAAMALRPGDMLFPSYRNQGLHIVRGSSLVDLMCQCLSNTRDMCKGRQMPVMYHSSSGNIFSISGNLATQFPQAVGWAMAAAIKGEDRLAASWIGEGSSAEADFHHALTFAAVYQAPVILNIVNNQWAISTFQGFAGGELRTFAARGPGYGIPGIRVDGNDFLAVYAVTQWAAERARRGGGPTLIEHVTYRAAAHSTSDDPSRYRPQEEWKAWPLGDPIERLAQHLIALGEWSAEREAALEKELDAHIAECWKEAVRYGTLTEGPALDPLTMFEDVFKELPPHLARQRRELEVLLATRSEESSQPSPSGEEG